MINLLDLPNELIFEIANYLENPDEVYSLVLTCPCLHRLLADVLFDFAVYAPSTDMHAMRVLYKYASGNHTDLIKKLITKRANVKQHSDPQNPMPHLKLCSRVMQYAIAKDNKPAVGQLLKCGVKMDSPNEGFLALHTAVIWIKDDMLRFLVSNGGDIHKKDGQSRDALSIASQLGHISTVQTLLQLGALIGPGQAMRTAIHEAARRGYTEVLQILLESPQAKAVVDAQDNRGRTALSISTRMGDSASVKVLLENGADPDVQDAIGRSPRSISNHPDRVPVALLMEMFPSRKLRAF